ncbi:MAG: NAD(P)H-dependent oxidoreductase [Bacteroidales bacterium]|nr:NAD(P)H-dependent oxidoreductase [Bacteroidales bacterium]
MEILVINGSPKGPYSITLHTCLYLEKKYPQHHFSYLDAGRKIRAFEKDFTPALEALRKAELIVFCYPVYTFLVPSQLHRFIELMKASGEDFSSKAATQVSTSKHFYDITAHRFIKDNCADMGMRCLDGLSADMDDILKPTGQKQASDWFEFVMWQMADFSAPPERASRRAVIVADLAPEDETLKGMIDTFLKVFPYECDVVNIREFPFQGGCISCFSCAGDGKCAYKDGFDDFLRNTIHKHDAILYAFRIQDHSMGSLFKMYDDRQFCNGHRTVTMGTPFGYIVEGEYSKEENLRLLLEARAQVGGNFLAGVASDEGDARANIDLLAKTLTYALEHQYCPPRNFLGVGGMKIFRDLIYMMRGLMRADHKFFKSHGQYDFPQKKWRTSMSMYLVGGLMRNKKLKAKMGNKMNEGMIAPYKKMIEKA